MDLLTATREFGDAVRSVVCIPLSQHLADHQIGGGPVSLSRRRLEPTRATINRPTCHIWGRCRDNVIVVAA